MANLLAQLSKPSMTNRPPGRLELQRNDLALLLTVALALFLGLGIRSRALNLSQAVKLGEDLPTLRVPAGWLTHQSEGSLYEATDSASESSFNAQLAVTVRELKENETVDTARTGLALKRSLAISNYRELSSQKVIVLGDQPGLLITYGWLADPSQETGQNGLPVVVQAQDLLFVQGSKLVVVTAAADANQWKNKQTSFAVVYNSLRMVLQTTTPQAGLPSTSTGGQP
jgi:hypothetical protein